MVNLHSLSEIEILTLTIYGEARGEPIEGQVAVANVIRNRLLHDASKKLNDIVLQPLQFSCWNVSDPNRKVLEEIAHKMILGENWLTERALRQCKIVAEAVYNQDFLDNVSAARHYMTKTLFFSVNKPSWAKNPKKVMERGNQVFLVL